MTKKIHPLIEKDAHIKHKTQGHLAYKRTPIEMESPEEFGYEKIKYNLAESSVPDFALGNLNLDLSDLALSYTDHLGNPQLRQYIAGEVVDPDHVLVTTGAAGALFIIATSLLKPNDHILILHRTSRALRPLSQSRHRHDWNSSELLQPPPSRSLFPVVRAR